LYSAIRKYGIEHFHIEEVEETDNPEEREKFWIEYYKSFKYGYNATLGGDGARYLDYDLILRVYQETQDVPETAKITGASSDSVKNILRMNNIPFSHSADKRNQRIYGKSVLMLKDNEILRAFPSYREAAKYVIELGLSKDSIDGVSSKIGQVCAGKRKTAYGFSWRN